MQESGLKLKNVVNKHYGMQYAIIFLTKAQSRLPLSMVTVLPFATFNFRSVCCWCMAEITRMLQMLLLIQHFWRICTLITWVTTDEIFFICYLFRFADLFWNYSVRAHLFCAICSM